MTTWAPGITKITEARLGGQTPAAVNRETGEMFIDRSFRDRSGKKLSADQWYFIMLHEMGHLAEQTTDEMKSDAWAHQRYLDDSRRSLKASVSSLTEILPFNKAEDMKRAYAQLKRAQVKDGKEVNYSGETHSPAWKTEYSLDRMFYGFNAYDSQYNQYYSGGSAPSFQQLTAKHERFAPVVAGAIIKVAPDVLNAVKNVFGGGGGLKIDNSLADSIVAQNAQEAAMQQQQQAVAAQSNTGLYIGIGAAVLVLVLIVILMLRK